MVWDAASTAAARAPADGAFAGKHDGALRGEYHALGGPSDAVKNFRSCVIRYAVVDLLQRGGAALMDLLDAVNRAKEEGATDEQLRPALELQRKAQWRLDFIAAENSMGFHAPQEAARVLGEAADYARQGQVAAMKFRGQ